jgi:hypothetical protein
MRRARVVSMFTLSYRSKFLHYYREANTDDGSLFFAPLLREPRVAPEAEEGPLAKLGEILLGRIRPTTPPDSVRPYGRE